VLRKGYIQLDVAASAEFEVCESTVREKIQEILQIRKPFFVAAALWHRSQNDAVDVVVAVENRLICRKCRPTGGFALRVVLTFGKIGSNFGNGKNAFCANIAKGDILRQDEKPSKMHNKRQKQHRRQIHT
jgi:hypothetical protein